MMVGQYSNLNIVFHNHVDNDFKLNINGQVHDDTNMPLHTSLYFVKQIF